MKKLFFFASIFRNISKTAETILTKKIGQSHGISVYKKALISEHRKNYIFRDNYTLYFHTFLNTNKHKKNDEVRSVKV